MERKSLVHEEEEGGEEPRSSCVLPHILGLPVTWLLRAHRKGLPVLGAALAFELRPDPAGQRLVGAVMPPPDPVVAHCLLRAFASAATSANTALPHP